MFIVGLSQFFLCFMPYGGHRRLARSMPEFQYRDGEHMVYIYFA